MRKKQKSKKNTVLFWIVCLILVGILIFSGIKIYKWYKENNNNNKIIEKVSEAVIIKDDEPEENNKYVIDFEALKKQNSETVAWLKVNNTKIEYPVVKTKNNDYYLTRSFDKSENSAGWIFADYKNKFDGKDKNIVVYGHNRRDGSMFGSLKNILSSKWYNNEENQNVIFNINGQNYTYRVFSVYQIEKEDYYIKTNFSSNNEYEKFLNTIKKRSVKDFKEDVSKDDTILTLSTCANNNMYRVVLHAKRIIEEE